ncbi:uncharacterized protein LOC121383485 [Gigantopelta aegis]|uniref:uncharacterized protein LOC121383485 n=1 Tax=Gigantopelta aegis TaxID=1735272 RepID=UPI001B88D0EF|nr:uncharacterized protein LOC121383485 [Gigantopelta aegis]
MTNSDAIIFPENPFEEMKSCVLLSLGLVVALALPRHKRQANIEVSPDNCNCWYEVFEDGSQSGDQCCTGDLVYDPSQNQCVWPSDYNGCSPSAGDSSQGRSTDPNPCVPLPDINPDQSYHRAIPGFCNKFVMCNHGVPNEEPVFCPANDNDRETMFNPDLHGPGLGGCDPLFVDCGDLVVIHPRKLG